MGDDNLIGKLPSSECAWCGIPSDEMRELVDPNYRLYKDYLSPIRTNTGNKYIILTPACLKGFTTFNG